MENPGRPFSPSPPLSLSPSPPLSLPLSGDDCYKSQPSAAPPVEGDPRVRGAFSGEVDETLSGRGAAASEDAGRSLRHPEERSGSCGGSCVCGAAAAAADTAGEPGVHSI